MSFHRKYLYFQLIGLIFKTFHSNSESLLWQNWVQSQGYRPGQALMLWKRLYGNDIWAHHIDEFEGLSFTLPLFVYVIFFVISWLIQYVKFAAFKFTLWVFYYCDWAIESHEFYCSYYIFVGLNKDFKKMLSENAEFKALSLKEMLTASDGTRKVDMIFSFCSCIT